MPRATFKQVSLRPGRYHLGGGLYRDLTAADLAAYANGTRAILKAGHQVPMLFEHAAPGSDEGAPVQLSASVARLPANKRRDKLASQVKHGAGWLKDVKQTKGGDLEFTVEAADPDAIKGLRNGTIKFTSPELREAWTDGKGKSFSKVISHVALTHKPRNPDQSAMQEVVAGKPAPALQFSLADWQQFSEADDEEEVNDGGPDGRSPAPDTEDGGLAGQDSDNPDAPKPKDGNGEADEIFKALLEHLKQIGLDLISDTTPESFQRDLLNACKVMAAVKAMGEAEDDEEDDDEEDDLPSDTPEVHEEKPPVQFSLEDADSPTVPKLLGLVMRGRHDQVIAAAEAAQREGQFPPSLTKRIKDLAGAMQFSADADEGAALSVSDVVRMLRETLPARAYSHWTADQFSDATVELPPSELTSPGEGITDMTPEQARAYVDQQAKFIPGLATKT